MVVSLVKPKWILQLCRKCFCFRLDIQDPRMSRYQTLACFWWVHHNVSTLKATDPINNVPRKGILPEKASMMIRSLPSISRSDSLILSSHLSQHSGTLSSKRVCSRIAVPAEG
jgi:hypothetical protein